MLVSDRGQQHTGRQSPYHTLSDLEATFTHTQRSRIPTFHFDPSAYARLKERADWNDCRFSSSAEQAGNDLLSGLAAHESLIYAVNFADLDRSGLQQGFVSDWQSPPFLTHLEGRRQISLEIVSESDSLDDLEHQCQSMQRVLTAVREAQHVDVRIGIHLDPAADYQDEVELRQLICDRADIIARLLSPLLSSLRGLQSAELLGEASLLYASVSRVAAASLDFGHKEWADDAIFQPSVPSAVRHFLTHSAQTLRSIRFSFMDAEDQASLVFGSGDLTFPTLPALSFLHITMRHAIPLDVNPFAKMPALRTLAIWSRTQIKVGRLGLRLHADPLYLPSLRNITLRSFTSALRIVGTTYKRPAPMAFGETPTIESDDDGLAELSMASPARHIQLQLYQAYLISSIDSYTALRHTLDALAGTDHLVQLAIHLSGQTALRLAGAVAVQRPLLSQAPHTALQELRYQQIGPPEPDGATREKVQTFTDSDENRQCQIESSEFCMHLLRDIIGYAPQLARVSLGHRLQLAESRTFLDLAAFVQGDAFPKLKTLHGTVCVPSSETEDTDKE